MTSEDKDKESAKEDMLSLIQGPEIRAVTLFGEINEEKSNEVLLNLIEEVK